MVNFSPYAIPLTNTSHWVGLFDGIIRSNERQWTRLFQFGFVISHRRVPLPLIIITSPDIYKSLGYDSHMQFSLNLVAQCVSAVSAWTAVSVADRLPRRKALVIGTALCSLMLAANAGFSAKWASCKYF